MFSSLQMSQAEGVGGGGWEESAISFPQSVEPVGVTCTASGGGGWTMDKRGQVARQHPNLMD